MKSIDISQHIAMQIATIRVALWPKVDRNLFLSAAWEDLRLPVEEAHRNVRINMQRDIKIKAER